MPVEVIPVAIVSMLTLFIGLPWLVFHYVTKWKTSATITNEDEQLLDELHGMARRLDDRMETIERIMTADNPDWRQSALPKPDEMSAPTLADFDKTLKERR